MIDDVFKNSGDIEVILDFRDLSKVPFKNDSVQAFDTKWAEVLSAVNVRPADSIVDRVCKIEVEKSEELKHVVQVYAEDVTFGDKEYETRTDLQ